MSCPFCGGPHIYLSSMVIDLFEHFFYCCRDCQCEGPLGADAVDALNLWTKRVQI